MAFQSFGKLQTGDAMGTVVVSIVVISIITLAIFQLVGFGFSTKLAFKPETKFGSVKQRIMKLAHVMFWIEFSIIIIGMLSM
jgi:hypothetical protein